MTALAEKIEVIVKEPEVTIEATDVVEDKTDDEIDTSVELEVPEGGIGGFVMSEEDISTLEAEEAKKEFGDGGLAQFTAVAKKMAGHGRFGDDSVAHIQTGEIVIPLTLLESNPKLKEQILKQLLEDGIEDPEQYVVGSDANSINPETGLMEFGAISKILRGIAKVIKKVIPIVLPILLAMTPLGPIYGAALGSGIGTLINGGDLGDAFKSALIAGAMGAATTGLTGGDVGEAFADPGARFGQTLEGANSSFSGAGWKGEGNLFSDYVPTASAEIVNATAGASPTPLDSAAVIPEAPVVGTGPAAPVEPLGTATTPDGAVVTGGEGTTLTPIVDPLVDPLAGTTTLTPAVDPVTGIKTLTPPVDIEQSVLDKAGNFMFRGGQSKAELLAAGTKSQNAYMASMKAQGLRPTEMGFNAAFQRTQPGLLARYGPSLAAASAVGAATGAFDDPNEGGASILDLNADGSVVTGVDLLAADPSKYLVHDLGASRLNVETGEYEDVAPESDDTDYSVSTNFPMTYTKPSVISPSDYLLASDPDGPFSRPYVQKADGGPIYPRRNGGVAPSEGVPGQDSVRAMLMPGEFVMTTDAVRGLGKGNLDNGIKSMYSVMRNLESRGRAIA